MEKDDFKLVKSYEGDVVEPPGEEIREIFSDENVGIGVAEARTGEANLHYHEETDEIYFVLEGSGKMKIEDEVLDLEERDLVYVPPGRWHRAYSKGENFKSLVISSPPWSEEDHHEV